MESYGYFRRYETGFFRRLLPGRLWVLLLFAAGAFSSAPAQFRDDFTGGTLLPDPTAVNGWACHSGDGDVSVTFDRSRPGYASVTVDATRDTRGIWWALIRRRVSEAMDIRPLASPEWELRVEARIKVNRAPRRVNLHLNTQRTTDFHSHLMEFDIADTTAWHTISMTTRLFDARPGDSIYAQLALMDWGFETYRVDLEYLSVDVVRPDSCGPDRGEQVPYHPPVPATSAFVHHLPVSADAMIDPGHPDRNFNDWVGSDENPPAVLLTVSGTQCVILRWDFSPMAGGQVAGPGLLELTTYDVQRNTKREKDFGMIRVTEILGGDPAWRQELVTCRSLCQGKPLARVFNDQMIMDVAVTEGRGSRTMVTISKPVLQRLVDGRSLGLAIRPLGAITASFYAMDNEVGPGSPQLHMTLAGEGAVR